MTEKCFIKTEAHQVAQIKDLLPPRGSSMYSHTWPNYTTVCSYKSIPHDIKKSFEKVFHTWSSVYPRIPFMGPSAAALTTFLMSSYLA